MKRDIKKISASRTAMAVAGILTLTLFVQGTGAYFSDAEHALDNELAAGTLSITSNSNWVPADAHDNFLPGSSATETITATNSGTLPFQYTVTANQTSGDADFCNALEVTATADAVPQFSGKLFSFSSSPIIIATSSSDDWQFVVTLPASASGAELQNKTCHFSIQIDGWQTARLSTEGFSDRKEVALSVASGGWLGAVVINEFLPNPIGSDNAPMPGGEWVELYNTGSHDADVAGWFLYDETDTNELPITASNTDTGSTIVPAGGFLVVYRNGDSDFALNNTGGDSVRLYTKRISAGGSLVDSYAYTISAAEDKSFARIPDGSTNWVDPIPTPGKPNIPDIVLAPALSVASVSFDEFTIENFEPISAPASVSEPISPPTDVPIVVEEVVVPEEVVVSVPEEPPVPPEESQ